MPNFLIDHLADVLLEIGRLRTTCLVRISTSGGLRMAFFEDGNLVYFASEDPRERVTEFLVAPGRLGDDVSRSLVASFKESNRSVVQQVVESGVASVEQLRPWLEEYTRESFGRTFDDRQGAVKVMPNLKAQHAVPLAIPALTLAIEGVRRMQDETLIRETLGPLDWYIDPAPNHMERLMEVPLNYQEGLVGSQLTSRVMVKELVAVTGLHESDALRAILALRLGGVLRPFEEPKDLTDTGRLRMRKAALESGVAVDHEAAAIALGMVKSSMVEEVVPADGALSMSDFDGRSRVQPTDAGAASPSAAPPQAPAPKRRGNTGQLRVLAGAYIQMAESEAASGNFNGAVQYYETALDQNPGDLQVILAFARYLTSFNKPQANEVAERLLRQGCVAHPTSVKPKVALARLYRTIGRPAQALAVLAEAERLEPEHPEVQELLAGNGNGGLFAKLRGRA